MDKVNRVAKKKIAKQTLSATPEREEEREGKQISDNTRKRGRGKK